MGLPWSTSNFIVNWHAITNGTVVGFEGLNAQPPTYATQPTPRIKAIKDGLGDTIFPKLGVWDMLMLPRDGGE